MTNKITKIMQIIYWTTKNGTKINIDDMSIEHLRNTLKMIVTQNQSIQKTSPCNINQAFDMQDIEDDLGFRLNGEMGQAFNDDMEYQELEDDLGYRFHDDECRGNQW